MNKKALLAVGAVTIIAVGGVVMMRKHSSPVATGRAVQANTMTSVAPVPLTISDAAATRAILDAGVPVQKLVVRSSGDVMILRGTGDAAAAQQAAAIVQSLGAVRVANLITPAKATDDEELRRQAERQLAVLPGLEGTRLSVTCKDGVVVVSGKVQRELQKDLAREVVRGVRGVREVRVLAAL